MHEHYNLKRRQFIKISGMALGTGLLEACTPTNKNLSVSQASEKSNSIKLGLSWKAEAEYGGFYQAVATGIYRDYGLEVEIQPIPPQGNTTQLLMGGLVDFTIGQGISTLQAVAQGIPKITLAAIFQDEIQVLLTHPGVGNDSLDKLKGKPVFITAGLSSTYWPLLAKKYGYTADQQRPYNFNVTPFLVNKNSAQEGILTSEPYLIEKEGGFKPIILPLKETGLNPYAFTIDTTKQLVADNPNLVERFVDASIEGWYSYLENPEPGNELIKQDNPEMTDELMSFALNKIAEYDPIRSGDAKTLGIGAMSDDRWKTLAEQLIEVGVLDANFNYKDAYTLEFVNKGVDYYTESIKFIVKC
ncbi:ABC transporter substrate-binding protein [Phormidium sp. CCY1219]|uniref:ABC transporter substrate-binding protein n=1 Tax=Phormidium sp. CCY1219 TaxID=2886104 RepID=UPI002D1ED6E2|nr:ABC transporter substrate-binding protein [Phormidium sp. CCY1219]MEB3829368.1 ABC transporter substrate-binding protein [Phormidium sp. CCY1219]